MLATATLVLAILGYNQENLYIFSAVFNNLNTTGNDIFIDPASGGYALVYDRTITAEGVIYVAATIIADALLLYRCYIVWGGRKYIIVGPLLISLANTALGLTTAVLNQNNSARLLDDVTENLRKDSSEVHVVAAIETSSFMATNLFTNIMLTGLIAGRIWWISKETRRSLGVDGKGLNNIVAIILESGSLYPVALIIGFGLTVAEMALTQPEPILTAVVGMAPTLIMIRTDLGISIRISSDEKASNLPESQIPLTRFIDDSTHF